MREIEQARGVERRSSGAQADNPALSRRANTRLTSRALNSPYVDVRRCETTLRQWLRRCLGLHIQSTLLGSRHAEHRDIGRHPQLTAVASKDQPVKRNVKGD